MAIALIVAAGRGERLGAELPKALVPLAGRPLMAWSVDALRQVALHCPLDSLLIETDSPFLTPVPHRGRRNSPSNVVLVGKAICELKAFEPDVLAAVTWMNTDKAFGLGG